MAVFRDAKRAVLLAEGRELAQDVNDYGGTSRFGISERQYPDEDIQNISFERAMYLIERDFWTYYRLSEIRDQGVANAMLLLFIHMNPIKAGIIIQKAVNFHAQFVRRPFQIVVDGVIGSKSIAAINMLHPWDVHDRLRIETIMHYLAIVDKDASQRENFRGWVRRALI